MIEREICNEAVEFTLTDSEGKFRVIRMREVGSIKRRALMQAWLIGQLIQEIRDKADALYPNDDKDSNEKRVKYVEEKTESMPSGQMLVDKVNEVKAPADLVCRIVKAGCVDSISIEEIEALLESATVEEVRSLFVFIRGGKKKLS
jgi:hypothetical protein